ESGTLNMKAFNFSNIYEPYTLKKHPKFTCKKINMNRKSAFQEISKYSLCDFGGAEYSFSDFSLNQFILSMLKKPKNHFMFGPSISKGSLIRSDCSFGHAYTYSIFTTKYNDLRRYCKNYAIPKDLLVFFEQVEF